MSGRAIHPSFSTLLGDLDAFISGQIAPVEFERRFFATNGELHVGSSYDTYQQLFYAVEDYVADPALRDRPKDLDGDALLAAAIAARARFTDELAKRVPITVHTDVDEFLTHAGAYGPCIAISASSPSDRAAPAAMEWRVVDGAEIPTLESMYDALAEVWHFPAWFGRNPNALDDFMRDLDNMIGTALKKPPAPAYLTEITNAHLLFSESRGALSFFASAIPFWRDYYRDEAIPRSAFGFLLTAPPDTVDDVAERWISTGVDIAQVAARPNPPATDPTPT
jgi:hypothetical protein